MAFAQAAGFAQPIVHLGVDVQVHIARPADAAGNVVVPYALQGHGQRRVRSRAADGQIAAEGKEHFRVVRRIVARQMKPCGLRLPGKIRSMVCAKHGIVRQGAASE